MKNTLLMVCIYIEKKSPRKGALCIMKCRMRLLDVDLLSGLVTALGYGKHQNAVLIFGICIIL